MENILTIDWEDWYQANSYRAKIRIHEWDGLEGKLVEHTHEILEILRKFGAKATFFVLAYNVMRYPNIIKQIKDEGHELGVHGYYHNLVYAQSPLQFRKEIADAKEAVQDIAQTQVIGFRAPNWSIKNFCLWALEILLELGFMYDSSMTGSMYNQSRNKIPAGLLEVPRSSFNFFITSIPFGGGFFLRIYPYAFTRFLIHKVNKREQNVVVYIHPWELSRDSYGVQPKFYRIPVIKFGVDTVKQKLKFLLEDFKFTSIKERYFKEHNNA